MTRLRRAGAALLALALLVGATDPKNPTCPAEPDWGPAKAMTLTPRDVDGGRVLVAEGIVDATLPERLKAAIDKRRTPGRFILTGSANVLLVPRLADSLAGRMGMLRLHPLAQSAGPSAARPNTLSCVLRIVAGQPPAERPAPPVALLAGDIEAAQEQALVAPGAPLRADLLLVPHHGSKTSSSPAFLDAVQPRTALVQAGYRNRFGHPAPEVAQRYRDRGIEVVESSRCGAAVWSSSAPAAVRCERDANPRYWQHRAPQRPE